MPTVGSTTGAMGGSTLTAAAPSYSLAGGAGSAAGGLSTAGMNIAPGLGAGAGAAPTGIVAKMMASPYAAPAMITGTTQLVGGVMQGYGARQEQKRQEQMAEDQRAAYNRNIGGFSFRG